MHEVGFLFYMLSVGCVLCVSSLAVTLQLIQSRQSIYGLMHMTGLSHG